MTLNVDYDDEFTSQIVPSIADWDFFRCEFGWVYVWQSGGDFEAFLWGFGIWKAKSIAYSM